MTRRRYTEQQFRDAVADPNVKTMADLCRALGLVPAGGNYESVFDYADAIDVSLAGLARPTAARLGDRAFLAAAARANSFPDLCRQLGLRPHKTTYRRLRQRARQIGRPLPAEWSIPGPRPGRGSGPKPFPEAEFRRAVLGNFSIAATVRDLGHPPNAAAYERFAGSVKRYGVDTGHFGDGGFRIADEVSALAPLLTYGPQNRLSRLAKRLVRVGLKRWACERCGLARWQGEDMRLELDHVNGDRRDNRLSNLRLLCPNCHSLTPTFRGRNRGARDTRHRRAAAEAPRELPSVQQLALL